MTLALRLRSAGCRVTLVEAAPTLGGLAAPQTVGGYTWDRFYHVTLLSDGALRGLLGELGLAERLHWGVTRTGFYVDGRMYSLSSTLDFLRFPPLGPIDKARLAATILRADRIRDPESLEDIPATVWLRRWSGRRTYERIWRPLLQSKLGENYDRVSAAFIWATIARMYAARRSGLKREMFGYVDGGYAVVLQRLQERLASLGVTVLCGRPAVEVRDHESGAEVRFADGSALVADRVVLTVPCARIGALCPQLAPEERTRLERVVYQGIVCASALLRRPLGGYYVTNLTDPGLPFTAVIEMTALVDRARFGGHTLVYLPRYLSQDAAYWSRSDDEIREEFVGALTRLYPGLTPDDVVAFQVSRVREVLALSTLGYSRLARPALHTSLPNVYIVNSAQITAGTLNVNETVTLANTMAGELLAGFAQELRARPTGRASVPERLAV